MNLKKIIIINGPNINLIGTREPDIYGKERFDTFFEQLKNMYTNVSLTAYQSNVEGHLIDKLHEVGFTYDGIVLNAGAYTHTSIAIADAIAAITTKVIELHISNIQAREKFRHKSYIAKNCVGSISGLGLHGYKLAIDFFLDDL
ncbi:MAG: type II 3-dehydroquinate dehydratase [Saprospiraceae bacterium]|nr:type II 3-dehydroquinate dehydratase [Saprospiraceae bacterium]